MQWQHNVYMTPNAFTNDCFSKCCKVWTRLEPQECRQQTCGSDQLPLTVMSHICRSPQRTALSWTQQPISILELYAGHWGWLRFRPCSNPRPLRIPPTPIQLSEYVQPYDWLSCDPEVLKLPTYQSLKITNGQQILGWGGWCFVDLMHHISVCGRER